jgi:hypothetical protein
MGKNGYPVALHAAERLFFAVRIRYVNELACREGRCRSTAGAGGDASGAPNRTPGEIYDFEYQPTSAGILQLEFSNQLLKMKVTQRIEAQ